MKIDILTLFPNMFKGPFDESIISRGVTKGLVEINIHDLRSWGVDERKTVDDKPYGGGVGMLIRVDVIDNALNDLKAKANGNTKVILLDARGERLVQKKVRELSKVDHLILIAGHYEGVDYRVHEHLVDEVISIGDFVVTGGEIPAMMLTDAVTRLIPGVISKEEATAIESFSEEGKVEFPQYTRPDNYKGWDVPEVLLSGNHKEIDKWRENN